MSPPYGDIRDRLLELPYGEIHGHASYALTDIFTVRWDLIRAMTDPHPYSVFEFGALYGYFLVTALDASYPWIDKVGWCDNEQHTQHSNQMTAHNLADYLEGPGGRSDDPPEWPRFYRHRDQVLHDIDRLGLQYDLISVDAGHSYDECLWDLQAAHLLKPRWIFVDDWTAGSHTDDIQSATGKFLELTGGYEVAEYVTANGLAVLTRQS